MLHDIDIRTQSVPDRVRVFSLSVSKLMAELLATSYSTEATHPSYCFVSNQLIVVLGTESPVDKYDRKLYFRLKIAALMR